MKVINILILSTYLSCASAFAPASPCRLWSRQPVALEAAKSDNENNASKRRDFLVAATNGILLLGGPTITLADDDMAATATVHKVDYPIAGKCGQAQVPQKVVGLVKTFGGFQDGKCAVDGYGTQEGTANGTTEKDKERSYDLYGK